MTFSSASRLIVERAAALAAIYDSEVRLFHVLQKTGNGGESIDATRGDPDASERMLTRLFALARDLPGRPRVSAAVTDGDPSNEILQHARLTQADLIAVGVRSQDHRLAPLIRTVVGGAPCPVLTVQTSGGETRAPRSALNILCCVDFLPASAAAAGYALALARQTRGRVSMVHVLSEQWDGPPRLLHTFIRDLSNPGDRTTEVVTSGCPPIEIVRLANQLAPDLIVMGIDRDERTHQVGSTAECVMHFSQCPVLLVPPNRFHTFEIGRTTGINQ